MNSEELSARLTRIETAWSMVFQAHQSPGDAGAAAQRQLLLRYHGAIYRYLLGTVHNADTAEELGQEFAVRFLRGDFKQADPRRGRFRDFLKTSLRHLVIDYWRRQKQQKEKGPRPLPDDSGAVASPAHPESDPEFAQSWREELLARTWEALAKSQQETGQPYHTVLRCKIDHPEMRSAELAVEVGARLGKSFSAAAVRQTLHRSRERFAALLVEEVAHSLQRDDPEALEQELIELDLLDYCRSALQRRQQP
jgi:RNA polymerase sigma-70 factor (ECF subfamily)